jgi:ABC-type lipoprotein release transport system permease subunit
VGNEMKKFRNLLNYALNCIQRYKLRTLVILIALGVAASAFSSVAFMTDGLAKEGALSLKYAPDLTVQGITAGRQALISTKYVNFVLGAATGISGVSERIWGYGNVGNTLLVIVGIDVDNSATKNQTNSMLGSPDFNLTWSSMLDSAYPLESGQFLDAQSKNTVVIGKGVAELLGAKVGTVLSIMTESNQVKQYNVVGIFDSESSIYSADLILMNLDAAREFFSIPDDRITDIIVYLSPVDSATKTSLVNVVARQLSEIPNCRVLTKDVLLKAQEKTYGDRSGFFSIVWYVILISVAIVAFNQTVVVGHESKFEVGLLKALGFSTSDIIQVRLIESLVLGALAGAIGLTFGILYDSVLGAPVLRDFMLGWANLYPSFPVPVFVSLQTVLFTFAVTIVPLLFATVIPSWLNATVDPDIAMRGARA